MRGILLWEFSPPTFADSLSLEFSDSKSPQVSLVLLSILVDFNNAEVWMVSTRPIIFNSSGPSTNLFVTVPRAPITIGINVTFMFRTFFNSLARSWYSSFFSLLSILLWSAGTSKGSLFCRLSLGLVVWPRLGDLFASQNSRDNCASHSTGRILDYAYNIGWYGQI